MGHIPNYIENVIMHDWWLYMVASCVGKVYYDKHAYIRYRQHQNNKLGAMITKRQLFNYRISQLKMPRGEIYRQIKEFVGLFDEEMTAENLNMAAKILKTQKSIISRLLTFNDKKIYRQKTGDDLVFRIIMLLGKL